MKRILLLLVLCGCPEGTTPPAGFPDATTDEDGGPVDPGGPEFDFEVVVGENSDAIYGDDLRLALMGDGTPGIAYGFYNAGSGVRELHVAERMNDGSWSDELAIVPGANAPSGGDTVGIGFGYVGAVPHLAYIGGDDDMRPTSPYPTDLMLATRQGGNWSERTLVDLSNEAPGVCPGTQDYCNFGGVVGTHASLAPKPGGGGFAVVYRDTHNSFGLDDLRRSDTEVYAEGGPFTNSNVDPVRGSGEFGDIAWLPDGSLAVAYNLGELAGRGVWAAIYGGGMWTLAQISESETASRMSLGVDPAGTIWLAFYDADASDLVVASTSDGTTWAFEAVDEAGRTGLHPSLAIDGEGRPVIAYTYCGPQSETDCPGSLGEKSVVRLARREGTEWKIYLADDGEGFGNVGLFNSIAILPDGKIAIAYQHARNKDVIFLRER